MAIVIKKLTPGPVDAFIPNSKSAKPLLTRDLILATGRALLDDPTADLSTRALAKVLGVHVNAVQHHLRKGCGSLEDQIAADVLDSMKVSLLKYSGSTPLFILFFNLHKALHRRPNLAGHTARHLARGPTASRALAERVAQILKVMGHSGIASDLHRTFEHLSGFALGLSVADHGGLKGEHMVRSKAWLVSLDPTKEPLIFLLGTALLQRERMRVKAWSTVDAKPDLAKRATHLLIAEFGS